MPITVTGFSTETQNHSIPPVDKFVGRVVRIERQTETRNLSGTLDYTDNQSITAVYALVWLGDHAVPPTDRYGRPMSSAHQYGKPCELKVEEQFAWIDCSNDFTWRGCDILDPKVDENLDPAAAAALPVWEAHQKFLADERAAKAAAEKAKWEERARIEAEKAAAKAAKKAAKLESSKATAEAQLAQLPAKGTTVRLNGFTGQLFWAGIKAYRGQYNCRVGVKDNNGNVEWGNARDLKVDGIVTEKEASSSEVQAAVARLKATA